MTGMAFNLHRGGGGGRGGGVTRARKHKLIKKTSIYTLISGGTWTSRIGAAGWARGANAARERAGSVWDRTV